MVWGRAEEDEDGGVEKVRGAEEVVESVVLDVTAALAGAAGPCPRAAED